MGDILQFLSGGLNDNLLIAALICFAAGVISSFSPCCLANISLIISFNSGYSDNKRRALYYSLLFCLGMTIVFTALGGAVSALGTVLGSAGEIIFNALLAGVLAIMALELWEITKLFPNFCKVRTKTGGKGKGSVYAVLLGAMGAVFSSPCATPVLVAILAVVSYGASVASGVVMLLAYSVGHSVLLVLAGVSTGFISEALASDKFAKAEAVIKTILGALLFFIAFFLLFSAL